MDIASIGGPAASSQSNAGATRNEALAAARRQARDAQLDAARVSQENRTEQIAASRELIARAIGADTRLSIARSASNDIFVYRAIDRESGEIVQEWPPQQFAEFVRGLVESATLSDDAAAAAVGAVINREV
ncbi:MAG: hypothetical protein AAGJ87_01270 [Pseudomonadota bacterium]